MALQIWKAGAWESYTAGTTVLPLDDILHFRDTAAAIDTSTCTVGPIQLPWSPRHILHGVDGGNGTITAGAGIIVGIPKGSAAAVTALPRCDSASAISISTPRTTSDGNEYGNLVNGPDNFYVRFTSVAGTSTTLSVFVQAHRS